METKPLSGRIVTVGVSLLSVVVFIWLFSKTPFDAVRYFFTGPFLNRYFLGNMINYSVPLVFTGLGISIAFKASLFNLGGEGQIYAGAVTAVAVCLAFPEMNGFAGITAALVAGGITAGLLAIISGFLKVKWNVDSMISSFLLSGAVLHVVDYLITGPLDDPSSSLLATSPINSQYFLSFLMLPSKLNTGLFLGLLFSAGTAFLVYTTLWGYEMRISGYSRSFAGYGGINVSRYVTTPFFISGFLHGLGGGVAVLGTYHMAIKGFTAGAGWGGIAVALLADNNPLLVVPAALFLAYLKAGANTAMQYTDVTMEIAVVAQAVVYFLVTSEIMYTIFRRKRKEP